MKYKFRIIPNEQTPKLPVMDNPVKFIEENEKILLKFMKFVRSRKNCAGLASNQLSLNGERITHRFCAVLWNHQWTIAVDPKIIRTDGVPVDCTEKCLTWLGKSFRVMRYPEVQIKYFDLKGNIIEKTVKGFHAQIFSHEIDHLNGVIEHVN